MRTLWFLLLSIPALAAGEAMQTRVFAVKSDLFGGHTFVRVNEPNPPLPIGYREPREPFMAINPAELSGPQAPRQSAKTVLLNEGISFPPGASASFNPQSGMVAVHNTPENLEHTRLFLAVADMELPENLCFMVTVVEAHGEMIRQANVAASTKPDAGGELDHLLRSAKQDGSRVRVVGDAFLECRGGSRFTFSSVGEHHLPSGMTTQTDKVASTEIKLIESGLKFEGDAAFDHEVNQIALNIILQLHAKPPSRHIVVGDPQTTRNVSIPASDQLQANFTTSLTCRPGQTRLIGITKPQGTGDEDRLWAAFLHVGVQRISGNLPSAAAIHSSEKQPTLKEAIFELPDGLLEQFMPVEPTATLQKWLEANGLAPVSSASASYNEGKLIVTNTQENLERLHGIVRDMVSSLSATPVFTFHTIEAPAGRMRSIVRQHVLAGDHAAAWHALEPAISTGEAVLIELSQITAGSEIRVIHQSGRESAYVTDFSTDTHGQASVSFERRTVGSRIELDSSVSNNYHWVAVSLNHELQTAPLVLTRHRFQPPAAAQPVDFPLVDFHTTRTTHSLTLNPGAHRLISLRKPEGHSKPDVLWATFVRCDLHHHLRANQTPPAAPVGKRKTAPLVETRVFQTPAAFFSAGWGPVTSQIVIDGLRQAGIAMSAASEVHFSQDSRILRVKASRECCDAIAALFQQAQDNLSRDVIVTASVIEAPVAAVREIARAAQKQNDHASLLERLQTDTKIGRAKHVTTMHLQAKGSNMATAGQTHEIQLLEDIQPDKDGETQFSMKTRKIGHLLELNSTLAPSGDRITLAFTLETCPDDPIERREHLIDASGKRFEFPLSDVLCSKLASSITFSPGSTRLVWIYRPPEAADDILHAVFLRCSLSK